MARDRERNYFIELNLQREKHAELIEWIKEQAAENEQSLSAFCISILKIYKKEQEEKEDA